MARWIALVDNYGYEGRYIAKGEVFERDKKPNEYFAQLDEKPKKEKMAETKGQG